MATVKSARTIKTSDEIKQALVYREAGYSLASISAITGMGTSTLYRHFKALGASKGSLSAEAVNDARQQLLTDGGFISDLKHHIASALLDDLSQIKALRSAISVTLEDLMADEALPAMYKSRAIAALATSINLSQKALRTTLEMDNQPVEQESLPNLFISELTLEDIEVMRRTQLELSGIDSPSYIEIDSDIIETVE